MPFFNKLRQYSQLTTKVRFDKNNKTPYIILYFSENSSFIDDYRKLNLLKIDVKDIIIPTTKIPLTRLDGNIKKQYKLLKLYSYPLSATPMNKNIIIDISMYLQSIDKMYNPSNYRQRTGYLIKNIISKILNQFPENYRKVLLYSTDITKEFDKKVINRKIFPIIESIKDNEYYFNDMLMTTINSENSVYRLLLKDKSFNLNRIMYFLKNIKQEDTDSEKLTNVNIGVTKLFKSIENTYQSKNKEGVRAAVKYYLSNKKNELENILSGGITKEYAEKIVMASMMYSMSGDLDKSVKITKKIPSKKMENILTSFDKKYASDLLKPHKTISLSDDFIINGLYDMPSIVDNKSPEHIFDKRKIDFQINLKKDMMAAFKILESKEIPIKIEGIEIVEKPVSNTDLEQSDLSIIKIKMKDEFGNIHEPKIEIPRIDPNRGTFKLNGKTKCLMNQMLQNPISFPKPHQSRFESSYSIFRINSKRYKRQTKSSKNQLEIYIGSYKLPFSILLFFSFGFEKTMKKYKIKYEFVNKKPNKSEEYWEKIDADKYIVFKNINTELKIEFVNSFLKFGIKKYIDKLKGYEFGTPEYFDNLLIAITGRMNSTFTIESILQNIVDHIAKEVLMSQQLPFELENIMFYMATKVIEGYVIERNDLSNQRIRNSEVLVALAQKQILSAYTVYKEQVMSGNKQAKYVLHPTKVLSDFLNTELVIDMEYANPMEEMYTLTKVTPIGKEVGGIPDKRAITLAARNVHPSYFGNIDPLDTPEGSGIGISQQLTIDAMITSSRGLIHNKEINDNEGAGMLSTSVCMTPFLENNDGARVIMASNQSRQVIPLKNPTPPMVQSGYESILTNNLSENFIKKSPCDGKIKEITKDDIIVECKNKHITKIDMSPVHLKSGSGKNTLSVFKKLENIKVGSQIRKDSVIAEGSCLSNGVISMGRNLSVAMMPYKGYNFEDGMVINERLVENDSLTSLHGIEEKILLNENDKLTFIQHIDTMTKKGEPLIKKISGDVAELIGFDEDDSKDIYGGEIIHKSPGGKIVSIEVFSNVDVEAFPNLKKIANATDIKHKRGESRGKYKDKNGTIKDVLIVFKIEQELKIGLGDKLTNRYGAKGIISLIEKDNLMPRNPLGETIDIILNPIGILGRMNMGQLYEVYVGLISNKLGTLIPTLDKSGIVDILSKVLTKLDNSKNKKSSQTFIENLKKMNSIQIDYIKNEIKINKYFPIVVPPFKAPNYKQIKECLNLLKLQTGYYLTLPEYNTKTKNKVPCGYMYMSKLEHIGEEKLHARSTGPLSGKVMQPTAGKRRNGGQRLGELDSYAYIAYDCPSVLAELMGPLSDDHGMKDEMISEIIQYGQTEYKETTHSSARDLLNAYFISLMLDRS